MHTVFLCSEQLEAFLLWIFFWFSFAVERFCTPDCVLSTLLQLYFMFIIKKKRRERKREREVIEMGLLVLWRI